MNRRYQSTTEKNFARVNNASIRSKPLASFAASMYAKHGPTTKSGHLDMRYKVNYNSGFCSRPWWA